MVRYRPHIFFVSVMLGYFLVRWLRVSIENAPIFLKHYLTDVLFVPAMCSFALIFVRYLKRDRSIRISAPLVFTQVALVSLFFEWYLPNYSTRYVYTGDIWDVAMYILGGILFLIIQRRL